jgi:hypothetical protein
MLGRGASTSSMTSPGKQERLPSVCAGPCRRRGRYTNSFSRRCQDRSTGLLRILATCTAPVSLPIPRRIREQAA